MDMSLDHGLESPEFLHGQERRQLDATNGTVFIPESVGEVETVAQFQEPVVFNKNIGNQALIPLQDGRFNRGKPKLPYDRENSPYMRLGYVSIPGGIAQLVAYKYGNPSLVDIVHMSNVVAITGTLAFDYNRNRIERETGRPPLFTERHAEKYTYLAHAFDSDRGPTIFVQNHELNESITSKAETFIRIAGAVGEEANIIVPAKFKPLMPETLKPVSTDSALKAATGLELEKPMLGSYSYVLEPEMVAIAQEVAQKILDKNKNFETRLDTLLDSVRTVYPHTKLALLIDRYKVGEPVAHALKTRLLQTTNQYLLAQADPVSERGAHQEEDEYVYERNRDYVVTQLRNIRGDIDIRLKNVSGRTIGKRTIHELIGKPSEEVSVEDTLLARLVASIQLLSDTELPEESTKSPKQDTRPQLEIAAELQKFTELKFKPHVPEEIYSKNRAKLRRKVLAVVALIGMGIMSRDQLDALLPDYPMQEASAEAGGLSYDGAPSLRIGSAQVTDELDWKVTGQNMDTEGYYLTSTYGHFTGQFNWIRKSDYKIDYAVPKEHVNHSHESAYVRLEGLMKVDKDSIIPLPLKQQTEIVNVQIRNVATGELQSAKENPVFMYTDGTARLFMNAGEYHVSYDLIPAQEKVVHATSVIQDANGAQFYDWDLLVKKISSSADMRILAQSIAKKITYDVDYKTYNPNGKTVTEYVDDVVEAGIVNCNVAATILALVHAEVRDLEVEPEHIAVASGYYNAGNRAYGGRSSMYLESREAHAFVVDGYGEIIDPTPAGSSVTQNESDLDKKWNKKLGINEDSDVPVKEYIFGGSIFTGLVIASERLAGRKSRLKKQLTASLEDPQTNRITHEFLTWLQYDADPKRNNFMQSHAQDREQKNLDTVLKTLVNRERLQMYQKNPELFEKGVLTPEHAHVVRKMVKLKTKQ